MSGLRTDYDTKSDVIVASVPMCMPRAPRLRPKPAPLLVVPLIMLPPRGIDRPTKSPLPRLLLAKAVDLWVCRS